MWLSLEPSSAKKDETFKFDIYEKEAVPYYIIIYPDENKAKNRAKEMCETILANPVIEDYNTIALTLYNLTRIPMQFVI
jgi:hypothetical protein